MAACRVVSAQAQQRAKKAAEERKKKAEEKQAAAAKAASAKKTWGSAGAKMVGKTTLQALREAAAAPSPDEASSTPEKQPKVERVKRVFRKVMDVLNTMAYQAVFYLAFVGIFQSLTDSLRMKEEYFFDKMIADTFLENHFDSAHNSLMSIRRVADVYEWGNQVLIPGLFGNLGPCAGLGVELPFHSSQPVAGPTDLAAAMALKGCNDHVWPDGEGTFALDGATGKTVGDVVDDLNVFDWTEGIALRQARVAPMPEADCGAPVLGDVCYPEKLTEGVGEWSRAPFGFNWTQPDAPLDSPWQYFTAEQLGANPGGIQSAAIASQRAVPSDGFVATIVPFVSDTLLPQQRGHASEVVDFRLHDVNRTNDRAARFFCVRLSWNGVQVHQLCDPNDAEGRTTGVVRAAVEAFWHDLQRGHFIDTQTRAVTLTMGVRSNHIGMASRVTLLFETTAAGTVLPSYDMQTRVETAHKRKLTKRYAALALALCIFFMCLEVVEVHKVGARQYFTDLWNLMDWVNFIIFIGVYDKLRDMLRYETEHECAPLCQTAGYHDSWRLMETTQQAKTFLSLCVCIQLLKMIKFTDVLVPKMSLMTSVLYKGRMDLLFFSIVFGLSMFAFGVMFYVQLGPVMEGFNDLQSSLVTLMRALFGDFDLDEIVNNSRGYSNAYLFLMYLFVAVFILLSIFLAILGEAQARVLEDHVIAKEEGTAMPEYGIITSAGLVVDSCARWARGKRTELVAGRRRRREARAAAAAQRGAQGKGSARHLVGPPSPGAPPSPGEPPAGGGLMALFGGGGGGGGGGSAEGGGSFMETVRAAKAAAAQAEGNGSPARAEGRRGGEAARKPALAGMGERELRELLTQVLDERLDAKLAAALGTARAGETAAAAGAEARPSGLGALLGAPRPARPSGLGALLAKQPAAATSAEPCATPSPSQRGAPSLSGAATPPSGEGGAAPTAEGGESIAAKLLRARMAKGGGAGARADEAATTLAPPPQSPALEHGEVAVSLSAASPVAGSGGVVEHY